MGLVVRGIGLALGIVAAVVAGFSVASEASAAIFNDVRSPASYPPAQAPSGNRERLARVDVEQLGDVRQRVRQGFAAPMALNLWADAEFDALIERTARTSSGYSLSGRLAGVRHGATTLVVNGDVVVGTVWTPSALYDIRTINGLQVIREVDVAALPPLAPPLVRAYPPSRRGTKSLAELPDDGAVVDVLVLWTAAAAKQSGGVANIKALIDLGVAAANHAYARSGVDFRLSLVGTEQTDFPDLDSSFELPFGLSDEDLRAWEEEEEARWDALAAVRDRVGADIVSIVMKMHFGGFGNLMHELSSDFESLAYNFVHVERVAYNTLAHEIGHNMGVHHDRHVNPVGGVFPYSHGYVNQRAFDPGAPRDSCWATIMAYSSQCGHGGHRLAVRIPYFSNPNQRYPAADGDPLGVAENSPFTDGRGPANAVASLNKARHVVANFRASLGDRGGATDHGDTASGATPVLVRSTTRGLLEWEDVDYFRIDVPRTGTLRVETTGTTDTHGELTDGESDTLFRSRDDNGGEDANFLIERQVKAGVYFVAVRGTAGAQGSYRLNVSLNWLRNDDHGDAAGDATRVATPSSTEGLLGVNDVDYFRIDLAEAAVLRVETNGDVDTHGKLAWLDGRAVLEDDDSGRNRNFRIETALPAGAYIVEVRGFAARPAISTFSSAATGFYTLDVWFGPDGQNDDHGDSRATATMVALPSTTPGTLETALDADTFRIELTTLGTVRVETTGNTDTYGRLFRASGRDYDELFGNDDGGADSNFLIEETLGSGTYIVQVSGFRGATTGAYALEASFTPGVDDHGDTADDATAIALPSSSEGQMDAQFDVDYFRVTLAEAGTLAAKLSAGQIWVLGSLVQEGRVIATSNATSNNEWYIEAAKLPAGVYFLAVRDEYLPESLGLLDRGYTLDVSFTPKALAGDDHGDTRARATAVLVPSTTAGELEEANDVDFFRFELPHAGTLRVQTNGPTDTRGSLTWPSEEDDDSGQGGNFKIETAVSAGRYSVQVRGGDDETTGGYALEVSLEPAPPDDHGDTPSAASIVAPRSTTAGELDDVDDADIFRIDVPEDGVLRVETTGDTDTVGLLASADGTALAEDDNSGALLNFRVDRWVYAGTYFVTVSGWRDSTGHYTLEVTFASTTTLANNHVVPLVLSAWQAPRRKRQSLVRIVNRSSAPGTVSIRAIDDSGEMRGPIALAVGAGQAVHFDSDDLEAGNPASGLSAGVGLGEGDWRLQLSTALDIEPLAFVRTEDGYLSSMHDTVPATNFRHNVPLFNPASNRQRASLLRLINSGPDDAEVTIAAVDDLGAAAPGGTVALTIPSGTARTVTAQQLEAGDAALRGRLGDGAGKWRLSVAANRSIVVMNLIDSSDGGLTNISTRPATDDALPLFLSGYRGPTQGFVRIVNAAEVAGEVTMHATDDDGRRFGPLALRLGPKRTAHFNSADLEQGNAAKGLSGMTGSGASDWRLDFATHLDIETLAYVRGPNGRLSAMHDIAPRAGDAPRAKDAPRANEEHRVAIFNPASNRDQESELRLVNPGPEDADITITGMDDLGRSAPEGSVSLTLPAQESRTITAQQLEEGSARLAGRFGAGHGRWRLTIASDAPIQVMNLLHSSDGQLSNLSTSPIAPAPPLQ